MGLEECQGRHSGVLKWRLWPKPPSRSGWPSGLKWFRVSPGEGRRVRRHSMDCQRKGTSSPKSCLLLHSVHPGPSLVLRSWTEFRVPLGYGTPAWFYKGSGKIVIRNAQWWKRDFKKLPVIFGVGPFFFFCKKYWEHFVASIFFSTSKTMPLKW